VIIVFLAGTFSFLSILTHGNAASWQEALAQHPEVPVVVRDFARTLTLSTAKELAPGSAVVAGFPSRVGGRRIAVVIGDCADLDRLAGSPGSNCTGDPQWIALAGATDTGVHPTGTLTLPDGTTVALPTTSTARLSSNLPADFQGALLLPSSRAATAEGTTFFLLVDAATVRPTLARISGFAPLSQIDLAALNRRDPDNYLYPEQMRLLTIGAGLALAIGVLALTATILAEARERSGRLRGLRVLGASRRHLFAAHAWATGAPLLLLGWTATLTGWLINRAVHAVDDRAVLHLAALGAIGAGVLAVALVVTVVTAPDAVRAAERSAGVPA